MPAQLQPVFGPAMEMSLSDPTPQTGTAAVTIAASAFGAWLLWESAELPDRGILALWRSRAQGGAVDKGLAQRFLLGSSGSGWIGQCLLAVLYRAPTACLVLMPFERPFPRKPFLARLALEPLAPGSVLAFHTSPLGTSKFQARKVSAEQVPLLVSLQEAQQACLVQALVLVQHSRGHLKVRAVCTCAAWRDLVVKARSPQSTTVTSVASAFRLKPVRACSKLLELKAFRRREACRTRNQEARGRQEAEEPGQLWE